MGAACCFFQAEDLDDRRCISLQCFIHPFANLYSLVFRRGEGPSTVSGATSLASQMVPTPDSFMCETFRAPPRPLPYDTDPKCSPSLQNGPVPKQGKSSSHCHEETEPLRLGNTSGVEILSDTGEGNALSCEGGSKICPDFSIMHPLAKFLNGEGYILNSLEDEDVCPTCLEEYTIENPKIVTQCSHHFHLGCIYEWMERSEACPVCGKAMVFDETS